MKKIISRIILIIAIIALIAGIAYVSYGIYGKITISRQNPIVTMEIEDHGTIKLELYPDKAPNTVTNFICLANRGFYNGTSFHRTIPDFVIQAGSKDGDGKTGANGARRRFRQQSLHGSTFRRIHDPSAPRAVFP